MSPAYLQAGPGMLWKRSNNLKVNIAPATSRLIQTNVAPSAFSKRPDDQRRRFGGRRES